MYIVYCTTNLITGKRYYGVHKQTNPNDGYLGSGVAIKDAIKKHGKQAFRRETLFTFQTSQEAYAKEKEIVTHALIASGEVYNLQEGGIPSIEWGTRRKQTALYGDKHPQFGKSRTDAERQRISKTLKQTYKEQPRDPSCWEKTAAKKRGVPSPLKGGKQTEESNQKRSEAHLSLAKKSCPHCSREISPSNFLRHLATHLV